MILKMPIGNKEVISYIEQWIEREQYTTLDIKGIALKKSLEALDKQIPKKPTPFINDNGDTPHQAYRCPICHEEVLKGDGCSNNDCRQCIDWGEY